MYIDPSAGSLVLQAAAAVALSGVAFLGRFRGAVKDFVSSVFTRRAR
ncbi:hypothetical protein tb265_08590 [Gemmatimonadetes bacterium T265]|nr:hypothetical protein tb265_08590 [Gemmatimonadetes bacterium T265]